jgi:glycosyltransferase involved in cell wall biosynthesis
MRVIHVLDHSIPRDTRYAHRTIAMLVQQRALGWETFHVTGPHQGPTAATEEQVDGWQFFRTPPPGGIFEGVSGIAELELMGEIAHRLEQVARRVRPHILHAHSPVLNVLPALRVGRRLGVPVIYEIRPVSDEPEAARDTLMRGRWLRWAKSGVENWALRRVDAVTTVCEAVRENILLRGIPPEKVVVVPDRFEWQPPGARSSMQSENGEQAPPVSREAGAVVYREVYELAMKAA